MHHIGRWGIQLAALALSAGLVMADDAAQILKATADTYQNLKSYHFEGTTTTETKVGSSDSKTEMSFVVAYKQPNEFRIEYVYPGSGNWVRVSDGKTTWKHRALTKENTQATATDDDLRMLETSPIADFDQIDQDVASASIMGSEPVTVGGQSFDCYVIQVQAKATSTGLPAQPVKFWIDKTRHLVLRQSTGESASHGSTTTENLKTVALTRADINQSIADDLFEYKMAKK